MRVKDAQIRIGDVSTPTSDRGDIGSIAALILVSAGDRAWFRTGHIDMRRSMRGLALQVQEGPAVIQTAAICSYFAGTAAIGLRSSGMIASDCPSTRNVSIGAVYLERFPIWLSRIEGWWESESTWRCLLTI